MKTHFFIIIITTFCIGSIAQAQKGARIGYIDMDYILENVPEYQEASTRLDEKVNKWKGEIEQKLEEVDAMKKQLDNERALLTKELIDERNEEIQFERDQILEYQQKRFGPGGDLSIQRRQLVEPVQDQVFNAVQDISSKKKYDLVFDKSSDLMMLYTADRLDVSDQVLRIITRAAKRTQLDGKKDEKLFDEDEAKTVVQDRATQERQAEIEAKKSEREEALSERARQRAELKAQREEEFAAKRKALLEERQRRKDSLQAVRDARSTDRSTSEPKMPGVVTEKEDTGMSAREAAIAERKRTKDSILAARKRVRDSILEARKKKASSQPKDGDN